MASTMCMRAPVNVGGLDRYRRGVSENKRGECYDGKIMARARKDSHGEKRVQVRNVNEEVRLVP